MKTKKFGIEKIIIHRNPAMSTLLSIGHESRFCPICFLASSVISFFCPKIRLFLSIVLDFSIQCFIALQKVQQVAQSKDAFQICV